MYKIINNVSSCYHKGMRRRFLSFFSTSSSKDTIRPRRAILYVPGNDRRKIDKVGAVDVDCVVLDCEDGVAMNKKLEARETIKDISYKLNFGRTEFAVRINSIDSGLAEEDIGAFSKLRKLPDAFMVPKVESIEHVLWLDQILKNHFDKNVRISLVFFVESAKALLDLQNICQAARTLFVNKPYYLDGLVFGSDDFCADIGATRTETAFELLTARQMFVIVAKAFKLQAIDMVHINFKDLAGLKKSSEEGYKMGFTGKQIIHPNQVSTVQEAFAPSAEKILWAEELIKLFKEHQEKGTGAFTFKGAMIDKPLLLQAEYIVKLSEMLKK